MKRMIVFSLVFVFLQSLSYAEKLELKIVQSIAHQIQQSHNNQLDNVGQSLLNVQQDYNTIVKEAFEQRRLLHKMQQQINDQLTPDKLVPLFFEAYDKNPQVDNAAQTTAAEGGISGVVFSKGTPVQDEVDVLVFDRHGYFAGSTNKVSPETGKYSISGLPSDSFYVVTRSAFYVDEIYENVPAFFGSMQSWKSAKKVFVPSAIVDGINFDLDPGVQVTGTITDTDGTPIESGSTAEFVITSTASSVALDKRSVDTIAGAYELIVPATGSFKVQVNVDGYASTWFGDTANWGDAAVVTIADLNASPTLNFKLKEDTSTGPVGSIAGSVAPPSFLTLFAAFDVQDTSFVNMSLSIFFGGQYEIGDLPPGDYFVYANDYLASLAKILNPGGGFINARGEFYDGASGTTSVKSAKVVTVVADQVTENINFELDPGQTIKGRIVNYENQPVDSLSVVILNANLLNSGAEPFLSQLELHLEMTDVDGNFSVSGIRPGEYFVRTLSDFSMVIGEPLDFVDGKHKGKIVDQFYGGESNLFHLLDVEPLVVPEGQAEVVADMKLAEPHYITGWLKDADTALPVEDVVVAAVEDTAGYPLFPLGAIDSLGNYAIGPIPSGNYKVGVLSGFNGETDYLTEYYDNVRSFYDARVISTTQAVVPDINFTLEKGAVIEGFVDRKVGAGFEAADDLVGMPVVVYNAESGRVASFDYVQYNGGYRINRLLPGSYNVAAVPPSSGYTVSYLGGGHIFGDAANTSISVDFGQTSSNNIIEMSKADGRISGTITDSETGEPLSSIFVGVYDVTGHLVGYDLTDYNASTGEQESATGTYNVTGLQPGTYYLRTVSLFSVLPMVDDALGLLTIFDDFDLFGFLLGGTLTNLGFDISLHQDFWYMSEPAPIPINLDELVFQASAYGLPSGEDDGLLPIYLPIPFYERIPANATPIQVTAGQAANADFLLSPGALEEVIDTGVSENPALVRDFSVEQNYPNPFNPSTTIAFSVPAQEDVEIGIYDVLGRKVVTLAHQSYEAGRHQVTWDGRDAAQQTVSAGLYIARVTAGDRTRSIKMLMIK